MSKVQLRAASVWGGLRRAGVMVLAAVALVVVAPTVASAATSFQRVGVFNEAFPDGLPAHQHRIAVNHASGDVYVTDPVGDQVGVYAPNGTGADPLTTFGSGAVTDPFGIAIDQSTGDVYVSDADDVVKFTSDGAPTPTFTQDNTFTSPGVTGPLAFDQTTHELLVADRTTNTIRRYGTDGTSGATFDGSAGTGSPGAFTGLQDLAVDSTGDVVVVDATGNPALNDGSVSRVERFAPNGDWKATIGPVEQAATVAIWPADDTVIVSGDQNKVYSSGTPSLNVFTADGASLGQPAVDPSLLYAVVTGIAGDDDGQLFVATDNGDFSNGGDQYSYGNTSVQVYDPFVVPDASTGAASAIAITTATLHGTVGPDGVATTYHFQYGKDTNYGSSTPESAPVTGSGEQPASADVSGLEPDTTYHYRLVATNANATRTGEDATFSTAPVPPTAPVILSTSAAPVSTQAALRARINPGNALTSYHFEYGPSDAYGTSTSEKTIAAGLDPVNATSSIGAGLTPSTTYHYRVVATNSEGTATGSDETFTTTARPSQGDACSNASIRVAQDSTGLPDCRAYEMVSPADKSLGMVAYPTGTSGLPSGQQVVTVSAPDGDTVAYNSFASFADPSNGMVASYRARRTPTSWVSRMWSPAPALAHPSVAIDTVMVRDATADLKTGYLETMSPFDPLDQDFPASVTFPTGRDVYAIPDGGSPIWQSRPNGDTAASDQVPALSAGHSDDGTVSLFETTETLTPEASTQVAGATMLYERSGGVTRFVALDNNGDPVGTCGSVVATHNRAKTQVRDAGGAASPVKGSVSRDGSRIYFSSPDPYGRIASADPACLDPIQVYLRDGGQTVRISASQRSVPDTPADAIFQGASADGTRVFFISPEALTNSATPGTSGWMLYEYEVTSGTLRLLAPTGDVDGVTFVSDDGSTVYYVQAGALKVAVDGVSRTVAALGSSGPGLTGRSPEASGTPDGRHLLFLSNSDPTDVGVSGDQAYLYSEPSDSLECVSCGGPAGFAPRGVDLRLDSGGAGRTSYPDKRFVSSDGRYAFFDTKDPLVPEDDNDAVDVYGWHDGRISLLSDGRHPDGSYIFDTSADGRDVFFATAASLVGWDTDNGDQDIYDARIGGGFAEPEAKAPPCAGDQCQGSPTAPFAAPVAGSVTFLGAGNAEVPPAPRSVSVSKPKTVTGTAATLKVKVPAAGSINLSGPSVGKVTKKASRSGTYSVKVSLTAKARASLKRKRSLKVTVTVAFKPRSGTSASKKVALTFKQPKAKKRSASKRSAPKAAHRSVSKGGR